MTRRKFSREFKIEVVRLVTDWGVAVAWDRNALSFVPICLNEESIAESQTQRNVSGKPRPFRLYRSNG
jgi:hypothetical protein